LKAIPNTDRKSKGESDSNSPNKSTKPVEGPTNSLTNNRTASLPSRRFVPYSTVSHDFEIGNFKKLKFDVFKKNDINTSRHKKFVTQMSGLVRLSKQGNLDNINEVLNNHPPELISMIKSIKPTTKWRISLDQQRKLTSQTCSIPDSNRTTAHATPIKGFHRNPSVPSLQNYDLSSARGNKNPIFESIQDLKVLDEDQDQLPGEPETERIRLDTDIDFKNIRPSEDYIKELEKKKIAITLNKKRHGSAPHVNLTARVRKSTTERYRPKLQERAFLNRFVDKLLVDGVLPVDTADYFDPNKEFKIKLIGGEDKSKSKSPKHSDPLSRPISQAVPKWLATFPDFYQSYRTRTIKSRAPIYDIVVKPENEREPSQNHLVATWLGNLDIFSKYPWDVLVKLASKLKGKKLQKDEILCELGDVADSLYIVYVGELGIYVGPERRLVAISKPGEYLGRGSLDATSTRAARLKAMTETYVLILERTDYQQATAGIDKLTMSNQMIRDFIVNHPLFIGVSEMKQLQFLQDVSFRKFYKNEVIYKTGDPSDRFFLLIDGKIMREMRVTINKENKWPYNSDSWAIRRMETVYLVTVPIEPGEIFGIIEMFLKEPRNEKIIVKEDSYLLSLTKTDFYKSNIISILILII